MSSKVQHVNFRSGDVCILREMLKNADYVSAKLKPLTGPLNHPSQSVLRRFMAATMQGANQMSGLRDELPYGHRREPDGTWTVFDTHSGVTAAPGFLPVIRLSEMDARGVATILNRNTIGTASHSTSVRDTEDP